MRGCVDVGRVDSIMSEDADETQGSSLKIGGWRWHSGLDSSEQEASAVSEDRTDKSCQNKDKKIHGYISSRHAR